MMNFKLMVIKNHISHYEPLEELLGFQYSLNNKFSKFYNEFPDPNFLYENQFTGLSGGLMFGYNIQFLQVALESLEIGYIHSCASNLRSVFEGIPKMYYVSFYPENTFPIIIHEYVKELNYEDALWELLKKKYKKILKGKIVPFHSQNNFNEFKKKYRPAWIRKRIYADDDKEFSQFTDQVGIEHNLSHVEEIQRLYDKFSDSSHANFIRNEVSVEYSQVDTDFFFKTMISLAYWNICAFFETSTEILVKMNEFQPTINFLNNFAKNQPTISSTGWLRPTNSLVISRIKLKIEE